MKYKCYDELEFNKYFLDPHSFFSCILKLFNLESYFTLWLKSRPLQLNKVFKSLRLIYLK